MGSNRRMDHMTWPEFKEVKTHPVIVPIGSTEQHGQHLPSVPTRYSPRGSPKIWRNASTAPCCPP